MHQVLFMLSRLVSRGFGVMLVMHAPLLSAQSARVESCRVQSSSTVPTVVELYTSEGCSSCPPADRWLSRLKADAGVIAMAFHVDYWDRLGWQDRFASAVFTQRQAREHNRNGSGFSYTPQVVVNGVDRKRWYRDPLPSSRHARTLATVAVQLHREGDEYSAIVTPLSNAPARLAAYWAVTEHAHSTAVKAGENIGEYLQHDFVVREYRPVTAWRVTGAVQMRFASKAADPSRPRHVNLVVVDAQSGRQVQAVKVGC